MNRTSPEDAKVFASANDLNKLSEETALIIAEETWEQGDVISLSKLVKKHDGPGEIAEIIKTLAKYGDS